MTGTFRTNCRKSSGSSAVRPDACAAEMGLPFVGIAADGKAGNLRAMGVTAVLQDFCDRKRVMEALEGAEKPVV